MITLSNNLKFNNFSTTDYNKIVIEPNTVWFGDNKVIELKQDNRIYYNGHQIYYNCNNCVACTTCNSSCFSCDNCTASCVNCDNCTSNCYRCDSCYSYCTSCTGCYSCYDWVDPCNPQVQKTCGYCNSCDSCNDCYSGCYYEFSCPKGFNSCNCVSCINDCYKAHSDCDDDYYISCYSCQNRCDVCVNICYGGTAKW